MIKEIANKIYVNQREILKNIFSRKFLSLFKNDNSHYLFKLFVLCFHEMISFLGLTETSHGNFRKYESLYSQHQAKNF